MRIAFFIRCLNNGGAERVAAKLTLIWTSLGYEVVVFTELERSAEEFHYSSFAREELDFGALDEKMMRSLKAQYGFEIAVFNDAINYDWFPKAVLSAKNAELGVVVICHHTANNWMYCLGNTRELELDDVLRASDAMVNVDPMWALWWHHRGVRSFYVPNPVSVEARKEELGIREEMPDKREKTLIWIGRLLDEGKQPEKMVRAFIRIVERVPDVRLLMLGTKTRSAERELLRMVPASMRSRIELTGFVANADEYLRKSALHVFTSLTEVTVPQVVLEAQACGVETVALDMPVLRGVDGVAVARDENEFVDLVVNRLGQGISLPYRIGEIEKKLGDRGTEVRSRWQELFEALCNGDLDGLAMKRRKEWQTKEEYDVLLDELHRSQLYFARKFMTEYLTLKRWKTRASVKYLWGRALKKLGFK